MKQPLLKSRPLTAHDFRKLYADAGSGPPLQLLSTGATLADLCKDYDLFTIAPLVVCNVLPVNPVREWMNAVGVDDGVWLVPLEEPIVHLGDAPDKRFWASKLWACDKKLAPSLFLHLGTMAFINRDTKTFVRSVCQDIPCADVVALSKMTVLPAECPTFNLVAFAVDGNKGAIVFEPAKHPPLDKPRLVTQKAQRDTVALAKAMFEGAETPFLKAEEDLKRC